MYVTFGIDVQCWFGDELQKRVRVMTIIVVAFNFKTQTYKYMEYKVHPDAFTCVISFHSNRYMRPYVQWTRNGS